MVMSRKQILLNGQLVVSATTYRTPNGKWASNGEVKFAKIEEKREFTVRGDGEFETEEEARTNGIWVAIDWVNEMYPPGT